MRKSHFEAASERIERYLSEIDRALTANEIAEGLGITKSSVFNTLQLMVVFGTVQRVKRRSYYYFLKGVYDEEQISAMLPPEKIKPTPRRRSILRARGRSESPVRKSFLEEHLSDMRMRAISGEGPSALAMIGLNQIDVVENSTVTEAAIALKPLDVDIEFEEPKDETPKKVEPFATVEQLPKDARKLNLMQTNHLKKQLKGLDGYDRIDSLKTAFAEFSALKNGSYGTVFYFSMGTNPWEQVYRVTLDDPMSIEKKIPVKNKRKRQRSKYDSIIDQFLESGHGLVEIDIKGRNPNNAAYQLRRRIRDRKLDIASSTKRGYVYLERIKDEQVSKD